MTLDSSMHQVSWRWDLEFLDHLHPTISFQRLTNFETDAGIARFGANVVRHQGQIYVIGGIIKDEMLKSPNEICAFQLRDCAGSCSSALLKRHPDCPRPILVGMTTVSTGDSLLIMGGSAVCFSFGTFWNRGCFYFSPEKQLGNINPIIQPWKYLQTVEAEVAQENSRDLGPEAGLDQCNTKDVPRIRISSPEDFEKVVQSSSPVVLEGLEIGPCTSKWTAEYLKEQIGADREVSYFYTLMNFASS